MHRSIVLVVSLLLASGVASAATWEIDTVHSSVQFSVRHLMISSVRGEFTKFSGSAVGDPTKPAEAVITATIDAASINTRNEKRDAHLRNADFFDVEKFPTITFKSKTIAAAGAGKAKVTGDLTMHGVTKEVVLDVEGPTPTIKDPMGNTTAGARATTKINRKDFGISYHTALDGGGIAVGEEVEITIDIEAAKTGD